MATSPTVLADTSSSTHPAPPASSSTNKFPLIPMLLAVVTGIVFAVLCVGGVLYYLARSGRLPMQQAPESKPDAPQPIASHDIVLEPLLVNLSDTGGSSYLRLALTLRVADRKSVSGKNEKSAENKGADDVVPAIRDTVLSVLGRQSADGLLAVEGKEHLKMELKTALAKQNAGLHLVDIYFTDFLVQR